MTRRLLALFACGAFALAGCQEPPAGDRSPTSPGVASRGAGNGAGTATAGSCDVVVPEDEATVQAGIDAASSGQTVCVEPGSYGEDVAVDKDVTLQGRTAARSGNPATVDGSISVEADGATVRRMAITRTSPVEAPTIDAFGIRITASNTVVEGNVIHSITGESRSWGAINGIQAFGGSALSDIVIRDNVVRDLRNVLDDGTVGGVAGIKLQADLDGVEVTGNRVEDLHSAGWAWGIVLAGSGSADGFPAGVSVTDNTMQRLNDGSVYDVFEGPNGGRDAAPFPGGAFGIDGGAEADEATLRYNNLLAPNGAESKDQDDALDATCNWWGDRSGPTHSANPDGTGTWALERGSAEIQFEPWLVSNAPGRACTGGAAGDGNAGS